MRVVAGEAGGRLLKAPPGRTTRPTTDRVKEGLFSALGAAVPGSRCLDLFAGSGALGIEALSRGAERAVFVEQARPALEALRRNLDATGLAGRATVVPGEVLATLPRLAADGWRFDLVLLDPPYGTGLALAALQALAEGTLLAPGAMVAAEVGRQEDLPGAVGALQCLRRYTYGDTAVYLYRETSR